MASLAMRLKSGFIFALIAGLSGGSIFCPFSWGQGVPPLNQQNPGLLTPSPGLQQEQQRKLPPEKIEEVQLDAPERTVPESAPSISFLVNRINVEGVTLFTQDEIRRAVAPYEGKTQTIDSLNQAVDAIARLYYDKGYVTSQAYIPPQDIENGVLLIRVQEGRIGKIGIEGNRYYRARVIQRMLDQEPGDPLNLRTLERDLNRSNRLNSTSYRLRASLDAGEKPGETDVRIQAAERLPFQITPAFDNQGRPLIGLYRWGVEARHDSLTGWGDRLATRWIGAEGTQVALASYSVPVNRYGTELGGSFSFSRVNVRLPVTGTPPEIIAKAYNYGINVSQPLGRNRYWTLDNSVNWRSVDTFFDGDQTDDTEIRALETGLSYDRYDRWGRTYNRLQSTLGVGVLNANAKFWKIGNYFTRIVTLPKNNMLVLRGQVQWTPDTLPPPEQMQIGGAYSVRGYTEGLLTGDRGVDFGIEHQVIVPGLHRINPWLGGRIQLATFYDIGRVWLDGSNPSFAQGRANRRESTMLHAVGFGVRAQLSRFMEGFVDVGFGLNRHELERWVNQPTARVHFGVRSNLISRDFKMRGREVTPYVPRHVSSKQP